ncbi:MAG: hypothetical protein WA463_11395 [Terriglobales bacterium]
MTLVTPKKRLKELGFSPCCETSGAKAQVYSLLTAGLKPLP